MALVDLRRQVASQPLGELPCDVGVERLVERGLVLVRTLVEHQGVVVGLTAEQSGVLAQLDLLRP